MSYDPASGPSWGLVLVRIAVGAIMMRAGWPKITDGVGPELVLSTREAFATAPDIVRWWGDNVVLQHPTLFANMIAWGEFLGGLALFLGALTRPVGYLTAFLFLNFVVVGPQEMQLFVALLATCAFGCAISRAGRRAGADVFLDERLPAWITWTRGD